MTAVKQYAEMVVLGSHALKRVAQQEIEEPLLSEIDAIIEEILRLAEKLRSIY